MTHDLLKTILEDLTVQVRRIVVTELRESTFFATIELDRQGQELEVSSRPSDAIALAVRMSVPIFASEDVLNEASILIPGDEEEEVEKFREFLDNVSPEDFEASRLSGSDPGPNTRAAGVRATPSTARSPARLAWNLPRDDRLRAEEHGDPELALDLHGAHRGAAERAIEDVLAVARARHEGLLQIRDPPGGPTRRSRPMRNSARRSGPARPCASRRLLRAIARLWASASFDIRFARSSCLMPWLERLSFVAWKSCHA